MQILYHIGNVDTWYPVHETMSGEGPKNKIWHQKTPNMSHWLLRSQQWSLHGLKEDSSSGFLETIVATKSLYRSGGIDCPDRRKVVRI